MCVVASYGEGATRQAGTAPALSAKPLGTAGWPSASMQRQLVLDVADAVRPRAAALLDVDRVQPALDVAAPKFEELAQLGKIGSQVELLPDEALEQRGVVRQSIKDL